jgi:hypothetical protein
LFDVKTDNEEEEEDEGDENVFAFKEDRLRSFGLEKATSGPPTEEEEEDDDDDPSNDL